MYIYILPRRNVYIFFWDIGWTARGTKKHGWHFRSLSTTSAWPEVQRFVNTVGICKCSFLLVHRLRPKRARHTAPRHWHWHWPLTLKRLFFPCSIATSCSAICVPDRPIKPLLLQVFVRIEGYHQRSVGPVKMRCYRRGQNHTSVSLWADSLHSNRHAETNVGSTHVLVAPQRGWEKCWRSRFRIDCNKLIAKSKWDGQ